MSKLSKPNVGLEEARPLAGMSQVHTHAAGVDIGAHEIMVCVQGGDTTQLVRSFGSYTVDWQAIGTWLEEHGVETVAMESTGGYWIPLFEELERRGFDCHLISSRSLRRVPGRKSDVVDCQWIQHRAPHILHMQKALLQMNIQLSQARSDISGTTRQAMIRAIVAGECDPHKLAALRNYRCKKDAAEIAKALTGTWRAEHLFVLKQSLELYDFYTQQLEACDAEIEHMYSLIRPDGEQTGSNEPPDGKRNSHSKNAPREVQVRKHLKRICGVDITAVHGVRASLAQTIVLEVGTDMSKFPDEKHFCSWLGLAPKNEISGGKVLKNKTLKTKNRAGQAFRLAAGSVMRADCAFGAFYRRQKSRLGPAQAALATAHLIARIVYKMLKYKVDYEPLSVVEYEQHYREQQLKYLQKKAAKFGFQLTPTLAVS